MFFSPNPRFKLKRFDLADATYKIIRRHEPTAVLLTGGSIPHHAMPIYYNAADVVLQTSYYEGSPTIVKESLACEVPLVSTDVGDTRDLVRDVPYCVVSSDNPEEFARSVLACRGQRAIGGRMRLHERGLSLDQVAGRLIQVYHRAMEKKQLQPRRDSREEAAR